MVDPKLEQLQAAVKRAGNELQSYLQQKYPKGSRVGVLLKHGQTNLSYGEVVNHWSDGHVYVVLDNAKQRSRLRVRRIHPNSIMWSRAAA